MVLAHVLVGDRLMAETGRVMSGAATRYDTHAAQSELDLHAVVDAANGLDGLVDAVERGGGELMARLAVQPDPPGQWR